MTQRSMKTRYMVALYVAAMVVANLVIYIAGKWASPFVAFLLIGFDLTMRDVLHTRLTRWQMVGVILIGGVVTLAVNPAAQMIAVASASAFVLAALTDYTVFSLMRGSWFRRANTSNVAGALVDSLVFPTVAFGGFMPEIVLLQFAAKVGGGYLWAVGLRRWASASL